jgi:predicted glycosyltransferase
VIGMAGANTVDDILSYRRPAVIVPRPGPSREQLIRARLLSERGLATVLPLGQCTSETLAEALRALLRDRGDYPESAVPDLNGVRRSVEALLELAG